ncbi:helix-turn-helix domain-containing protein [Variovorax guangxiensis]|uniref:Transcriptional regulator with XRE-family HTH domain n=1 Tax=Variovorax guangxiensis TaxID=1775474 RepID=A0A840FPU0_9BURK|nr:helix-turn-helix transcriptional regulator [Variovorax guangxiensis]MBB4223953.1 transcriptional regulator with XRE-family HTH domain [Variovorax guangxiensis]
MTEATEEGALFRDTSRCFVEAVRRSMRVASEDDSGSPDALTQTELAERALMSRSTLAKYLGGRSDEAPANPDLDIICRLAHAVGVPPAILLMRPQDWASLGSGMLTFLQAMSDPKFTAMATELQMLESTTSQRIAEAALRVGRLLKTVENEKDSRVSQELRDFRHASNVSIATTAASIPFRMDGVATSHLPALLTICSILGTTTARTNQ